MEMKRSGVRSRVIITGFGPFRTFRSNPSWEAVQRLPDTMKEGVVVDKHLVSVDYREVYSAYHHGPLSGDMSDVLAVIHVGVSNEAKRIVLEKCAYNECEGLDVNGYCPPDHIIVPNGEKSLATSLGKQIISSHHEEVHCIDVDVMCRLLNDNHSDISFGPSIDPGRYLCNFIYYLALTKHNQPPSLFVHIPPTSCYAIEKTTTALERIILQLVSSQ